MVVVSLLQRAGLPTIAGLILVGVLVGPNAFGLIQDKHHVEVLAEVGVVLLLFGIGLELSLDRMKHLWKPILIGGTLQVFITIAAVSAVTISVTDLGFGRSIFLGFVIAISSTAIVLRSLESRGEIDAPHGRLTLGILVFQDLCVVPMILAIPLLGRGSQGIDSALLALGKSSAILTGVLLASTFVAPRILDLVARTRKRELFVLAVFLICIGTAWTVSLVGVSLALGAFLAGLVVARSEYRHQALTEIIPFREVFTSIFFVSVGMLLDPFQVAANPWPILGLLGLILVGKFFLIFVAGIIMRLPLRVSALAASALSQVGEFSFVLFHVAKDHDLTAGILSADLPSAVILSMLITPLLLALSPHIAAGVGKIRILTKMLDVETPEEVAEKTALLSNHVIIAGYGMAGQELARSLGACRVPFVIVDLNPANVRSASRAGQSAYFGDITSAEVLHNLGAARASDLVILVNDPGAAERALREARKIAPALHKVVRSRYLAETGSLLKAGADIVIPAELEAASAVVSHVLEKHCVDEKHTQEQMICFNRKRTGQTSSDLQAE